MQSWSSAGAALAGGDRDGGGDGSSAPPAAVAVVRVVADAGERGGSIVDITVRVADGAPVGGLPTGWQLCFTWLKAVVLRLPEGGRTAGSFVELPKQRALAAGESRTFRLALQPPAMRYASDLPRSPHILVPRPGAEEGAGGVEVLAVDLEAPAEAHIRFDPEPPPPSGVVPLPVDVDVHPELLEGWFALPPCEFGPLQISTWSAEAAPAAALLQAWAEAWPPGAPLAAVAAGNVASKGGRTLLLAEASEPGDIAWLGREGYELLVSQTELLITAASAEGFHRGAATLRQVLSVAHSEGRSSVPPMRVRDRPRFGYRGLMLDVARHFFDVPFIKRLLDLMYLYKLNVFHWHLTDDEGWRLEVKALPNLTTYGAWRGHGEVVEPQYGGGPGRYGGYYKQEQIRDIVLYAAERGIAIVPEIDVPGHCYAAIRALPGLLGPAVRRPSGGPRSVQGFEGNVLDPAAPETYTFLEAVFSEVADLFPAPLGIHVGMDEIPRGAWSDSESEEQELKATLVAWLQQFLAARGKALLGWEEAFHGPGAAAATKPNAVAYAWKENERFAAEAAVQGFGVVLCPAHFMYLDLVEGTDFEDRGLYWASPTLPIDRVYSYEPMERLRRMGLPPEAEGKIRGIQANLWSETVDSAARAEEMLFPRLLAAAEVAWTALERRSLVDFQWRLSPQLAWLAREMGVRHGGQATGLILAGNFLRVPRSPEGATRDIV